MNNLITVKDIIYEDFVNYKKPSMFIATSKCSFKCEKEDCNVKCQNSPITKQPNIQIPIDKLINRYLNNNITRAVVFGGLEPMDQLGELLDFIIEFRTKCNDDIIIYTGYTEDEMQRYKHNRRSFLDSLINANKSFSNDCNSHPTLIIKYGRFKSSNDKIYDEILGIDLASSNQYAKAYI